MKLVPLIVGIAVVLPALASCCLLSSKIEPSKPVPPITEEMRSRAGKFRAALEKVAERSVFIIDDELDFYEELPDSAAERLALLGINQVYFNIALSNLRVGSQAGKLRVLIAALTRKNIESSLVINESELLPLFGRHSIAASAMRNIVNTVAGYNNSAASGERFSSLAIELVPHRINTQMTTPPEGLLFSWSDRSFGESRDNDMLMRYAVSLIDRLKSKLPDQRFRIITEDFFHELHAAGKLTLGSVNDLLKHAEAVIIATRQTSPAETIEAVRNELADAVGPNSIIVKVMTSRRLFGIAQDKSWTRDRWDSLLENVGRLTSACKQYPAWRGIAFDSFGGVERCWER